jgi:hypothetical protein
MGREQPWHGIYAGETRLLARLLTDARRTADPAQADAFYVPSWPLSTCGGIGQMHSGACMQVRAASLHSLGSVPRVSAQHIKAWSSDESHGSLKETSVTR